VSNRNSRPIIPITPPTHVARRTAGSSHTSVAARPGESEHAGAAVCGKDRHPLDERAGCAGVLDPLLVETDLAVDMRHVVIDHDDARIVHVVQDPLAERTDADDLGGWTSRFFERRPYGSTSSRQHRASRPGRGRRAFLPITSDRPLVGMMIFIAAPPRCWTVWTVSPPPFSEDVAVSRSIAFAPSITRPRPTFWSPPGYVTWTR